MAYDKDRNRMPLLAAFCVYDWKDWVPGSAVFRFHPHDVVLVQEEDGLCTVFSLDV